MSAYFGDSTLTCAGGYDYGVWLFRPPGVHRPQAGTWLLAEALRGMRAGGRVLDVGTGTGALALVAALSAAAKVARRQETFRPVMLARAGEMEDRGLIQPAQRYEHLVVIRAFRVER